MGSGRRNKRGRRGINNHASRWTSSSPDFDILESSKKKEADLTEAELAELAALERVGQRRQRRYLNDKFLRDMNPALTAKEMESLFKPAPFGESYISPFTLASMPENAPLWDLFRSVDSDKQARVLMRWEEYVKELQHSNNNNNNNSTTASYSEAAGYKNDAVVAAFCAYHGWVSVGHRGKKALHRAPAKYIEQLEKTITDFIDGVNAENTGQLVLDLDDAFHRLLAHGLAEYYFLNSFSRNCSSGRQVVMRQRTLDGENMPQSPEPNSRISCSEVLWLLKEADVDHNSLVDALLHPEGDDHFEIPVQ